MDRVLEWAQDHGVIVVEDAAQAHGAVHRSGRCGTLGLAAAFSFYPAKNLGACGDAGAICTNDDNLAESLRLLRNWGSSVKYIHQVLGFNSRLDTLQAAVLLVKLRHLPELNAQRRRVVSWYRKALAPLSQEVELPHEASWTGEHVYHLFVVKLRRADRDAVVNGLQARGVGAGIHYPVPLHLQKAYSSLGLGPGSFPVTEDAAKRIVSLPLYPELTRDQVDTVVRALGEVLAPGMSI
jgi:dTDP-4-amino-4,6-dideoxygalactose transaminase